MREQFPVPLAPHLVLPFLHPILLLPLFPVTEPSVVQHAFRVVLSEPSGGAALGHRNECRCMLLGGVKLETNVMAVVRLGGAMGGTIVIREKE